MKNYSHLNQSQRYALQAYLSVNKSRSEISALLEVSESTISRELKRNCDDRNKVYRAELAERKYQERIQKKAKVIRLTHSVKAHIKEQLKKEHSPEQIYGYAKRNEIDCVSHETIYKYIWANKKAGGDLHTYLRNQGKRYRKRGAYKDRRGLITNRIPIDKRPEIVEPKTRFGDLEIDTIIGKNHKGAIVTINDRKTGLLRMKKVSSKEAKPVKDATLDLLEELKPMLHTITSDNGKEFALHQKIASRLDIDFYFAKPYHSWQRGANENLNGLIRQYIPKKTNFDDVTDKYIKEIEEKINNRPRKRFGYKNPNQQFVETLEQQTILALAT